MTASWHFPLAPLTRPGPHRAGVGERRARGAGQGSTTSALLLLRINKLNKGYPFGCLRTASAVRVKIILQKTLGQAGPQAPPARQESSYDSSTPLAHGPGGHQNQGVTKLSRPEGGSPLSWAKRHCVTAGYGDDACGTSMWELWCGALARPLHPPPDMWPPLLGLSAGAGRPP
eukprot:gene3693-biopygen9793